MQPNDLARFKPEPLIPKTSSLSNEPSPIKGNHFKKMSATFLYSNLLWFCIPFFFFFYRKPRRSQRESALQARKVSVHHTRLWPFCFCLEFSKLMYYHDSERNHFEFNNPKYQHEFLPFFFRMGKLSKRKLSKRVNVISTIDMMTHQPARDNR